MARRAATLAAVGDVENAGRCYGYAIDNLPAIRFTKEAHVLAQHRSESVEHYTPADIVEASRAVLEAIDLDPASCELAQRTVKAAGWYGPGSPFALDGLTAPWFGRVFLNPPGGKAPDGAPTRSNAATWFTRLSLAWVAGDVDAAIFVGFSLEILRSTQGLGCRSALEFPICVPRSRIAFDTVEDGRRVESSQPTNANVIIFLPPLEKRECQDGMRMRQTAKPCLWTPAVQRFVDTFSAIGMVRL